MSPNPPHPRSTPPPRWSEGAASAERPPPSPRADRSTDQSRRIPPTRRRDPGGTTGSTEPVASTKPLRTNEASIPRWSVRTRRWERRSGRPRRRFGSRTESAFAAFTQTRADRRSNSRGSTTRSRRSIATRGRTARAPWRCVRRCWRPRSRFLRRRGRRSRGSSCRWPCTETPRGCTL